MKHHLKKARCKHVVAVMHPASSTWQYVYYLEISGEPIMLTQLRVCTRMNIKMAKRVLRRTKERYPKLPVQIRTIIYI